MNALFEIGQKVVCVDSSGQSRITEGKTYTVKNAHCCKCGFVRIDVGVASNDDECLHCDNKTGACIYFQTRFVPLDADHQLEEEIHEALKGNKILN